MPPYATGETGRVGNPGRREIGHGALQKEHLFQLFLLRKNFHMQSELFQK